jgi:hypothetical protein
VFPVKYELNFYILFGRAFVDSVWFSQYTSTVSPNSINRLVFVEET